MPKRSSKSARQVVGPRYVGYGRIGTIRVTPMTSGTDVAQAGRSRRHHVRISGRRTRGPGAVRARVGPGRASPDAGRSLCLFDPDRRQRGDLRRTGQQRLDVAQVARVGLGLQELPRRLDAVVDLKGADRVGIGVVEAVEVGEVAGVAAMAGAIWASQTLRTSCLRPGRVWCRMIKANWVITQCCHQSPTAPRRRRRPLLLAPPHPTQKSLPSGRSHKPEAHGAAGRNSSMPMPRQSPPAPP